MNIAKNNIKIKMMQLLRMLEKYIIIIENKIIIK